MREKTATTQWGHARQKGAEIVEFLITLPVVLIVLAIMFDFGALFSDQIILTNAARAGAREVINGFMIDSSGRLILDADDKLVKIGSQSDAQTVAESASNRITQSLLSGGTTVTVPQWGPNPGDAVTVTVDHVFQFFLLPSFASSAADINLSATVTMDNLPN